jgi:hypothetical protein
MAHFVLTGQRARALRLKDAQAQYAKLPLRGEAVAADGFLSGAKRPLT